MGFCLAEGYGTSALNSRRKNMETYQSKLHDYKETGIKPFDWGSYNESQTKEKFLFFHLLKELLETVDKTSD